MKRLLLLGLLAGLLGVGLAKPWTSGQAKSGCSGCCTTPADCPTPSCCSK